ncbi:hypothetical protein OTU49_015677 [Cherax quadricarinatus]|uniref:Uncharacterized protein n=1 Tax=Cherax quadricarinatus TaxID=27406 RepID=A0AAW0YAS9_CHEQU
MVTKAPNVFFGGYRLLRKEEIKVRDTRLQYAERSRINARLWRESGGKQGHVGHSTRIKVQEGPKSKGTATKMTNPPPPVSEARSALPTGYISSENQYIHTQESLKKLIDNSI